MTNWQANFKRPAVFRVFGKLCAHPAVLAMFETTRDESILGSYAGERIVAEPYLPRESTFWEPSYNGWTVV